MTTSGIPDNWQLEEDIIGLLNREYLPRLKRGKKGQTSVGSARITDTVLAIMDDAAASRVDPYIRTRADCIAEGALQWAWRWMHERPVLSPLDLAKLRVEVRRREAEQASSALESFSEEITYNVREWNVPRLKEVLTDLLSIRDTFPSSSVGKVDDMIKRLRSLLNRDE